ncbi:hypothetical protein MYCTH_45915 [Thermothelomyces thermophilus ATCC 42464]|uniref:Uncharacterized protein n=1 Tax=Thermothelomyces thermophilus (strain ATCC 42464 / BCRC 31852 / DSM 1799) TaxID=573729 RepID=G2Q9K7_THET4|nr:uncharacterized protein MYCTH_45915 [Thermothelomyces thermophilus ATCC 42464]AEO56466.1 hypothetical protein MYCTH_45915 [Thermothelomyces thermophilus ATCC 42464]
MTDRHASSSSRTHASGVSKTRSGVPSSSSVRRNLFPSQLTRRPTALSPAPEDLHSDEDGFKDEIVARDHNGEVELGDPPTPLIDDPGDTEAIEARHVKEIERQRLAEAVKQHRIGQHNMPAQQEGKTFHLVEFA